MQSERVAFRQGPAHARCGVGEGREMGKDSHLLKRDEFQKLTGNAVVHGIAGREDHCVSPTQRFDLLDNGRKGLRPFQVFKSMESDLSNSVYDTEGYEAYIYGSAEVVGLMCLYVFCEGDKLMYEKLKPSAQSLGAAFQKVNFLRDVKADYQQLNRTYFPQMDFKNFTTVMKLKIENEIAEDFTNAYSGILQLPVKARFGVYVAYKYYLSLFKKIKKVQPAKIMEQRIRIPHYSKAFILAKAGIRTQFNML